MKVSNPLKFAAITGLGVLLLGVASTSASAATATASFTVTASVQATCIVSAGTMDFGNYVSTAASTPTSTITVTCTNTTPYTVGLDAGTSGGTVTTRQMKNGSAALNYSLYSDSARSTNWGNSSGSWLANQAGTGAAQNITVYGTVAAGQYVTPGTYNDTITATITY